MKDFSFIHGDIVNVEDFKRKLREGDPLFIFGLLWAVFGLVTRRLFFSWTGILLMIFAVIIDEKR